MTFSDDFAAYLASVGQDVGGDPGSDFARAFEQAFHAPAPLPGTGAGLQDLDPANPETLR